MPPPTLLIKGNLIQPDLPDVVPINYLMEKAQKMMTETPSIDNPFLNRLMIIEAKTASGKSTTIPPLIYKYLHELSSYERKSVMCTQPRILTTQAIAESIDGADYYKDHNIVFKLGENLGYQTSAVEYRSYGPSLLFVTLGVLEVLLQNRTPHEMISKYSAFIIDEAHERAQIFDSTMVLLKRFYHQNSSSKQLPLLILMSATFDHEKYRKYFGVTEENVYRVKGFSYNIDERWPDNGYDEVLKAAADKIYECILEEVSLETRSYDRAMMVGKPKPHTITSMNRILVFVPGSSEHKKVARYLGKMKLFGGKVVESNGFDVLIRADEGYIDSDGVKKLSKDYIKIMGSRDDNRPKCDIVFQIMIIHINAVGETGLTLDDLKYVIDIGWFRGTEFNPSYNITHMLLSKPAAQSQIMQRRGRCGRMKDGVFIPLYTKKTFEQIQPIQTPDILMSDPTGFILNSIVATGTFNNNTIAYMMDTPPQESIEYSIHKLQLTGFIDSNLNATPNGTIASKLVNTIKVESIAMILAGFIYGASIDDLAVIAVMITYWAGDKSYFGHSDEKVKDEMRKNPNYRPPSEANIKNYQEIFDVIFGTHIPNIYYKLRALLADDFITSLLIYRAFERKFTQLKSEVKSNEALLMKMRDWCDKNTIKLDTMLDVHSEIIGLKSNLVQSSVDITYAAENDFVDKITSNDCIEFFTTENAKLSDEIVDPIVRLKLCIYHGYKFNLAVLDKQTMSYRINYGGYMVPTLDYFGNNEAAGINWKNFDVERNYSPDRIVFADSMVAYKKDIKSYTLSLKGISFLSGYL